MLFLSFFLSFSFFRKHVIVDIDKAMEQANKREDLCTSPKCPYFRCRRKDCPRLYDHERCDPHNLTFRINFVLAGAWWFALSLFTIAWLKTRPAPPLPEGTTYVGQSLRRLKRTAKKIRKLPNTFLFLCSFWLFSDGMATLTVRLVLVLFLFLVCFYCIQYSISQLKEICGSLQFASSLVAAQSPLFFEATQLGLLLLEVNLTALCGNFAYEQLSKFLVRRWSKNNALASAKGTQSETNGIANDSYWVCKVIIAINLFFILVLPIWGLPGLILFLSSSRHFVQTLNYLVSKNNLNAKLKCRCCFENSH